MLGAVVHRSADGRADLRVSGALAPIAKPPDQPSDQKEQIVVIPEAIDSFAAVASFYGGAVPDLTPVVLPPGSL